MRKIVRFLTLAVLLAAPWGGYFNQVQAQQSLPYSYGFENNNLATDGWLLSGAESSYTGIIGDAAQNGSYGFRFNYDEENAYLLSPIFTGNTAALSVTFSYKEYSSDYGDEQFYVGYTTDASNTDPSTYTYGAIVTASTSWQEYENTFPAGTKRIAIQYVYNDAFYLFLDDFTFEVPAGCAKPTALTATVTPGSGTIATLSWTAGGTETDWTVEYGTAADFTGAVSQNVATTPTLNLTGLIPETQYYARVKAVCGVGDESNWSNTVTFTPSNAYSLTVNDGTATNGYVPIYGYYVDGSIVSQFIIPAASLSSIQWATLSEMTFYSSTATASWTNALFEVYVTEVDYTTFTGTTLVDWTTMTKVMNAAHLQISGNQMVVTFDTPYQYTGGNLMIGVKQTVSGTWGSANFYGVSATGASLGGDGTGSQQNFLPKVTFAYTPGVAPSCTKPTALAAGSVTATGATLGWTAGGTETQWMVEYGTASDFAGAASQNVSTTPTLALTGLEPATTYYVRVKAVCSGSDESDWTTASFTTECAAIAALGYTENFDALTAGDNVLPLCWSYINTTTYSYYQGYPKAYNYSAQSASNCLYFYSYDYSGGYYDYDPQPQYAILPEMTGLSGKQVTLSAKGYSSSSTFKIGTMNNPADASSFTLIAEQTLTTSYQEFAYLVPSTTDAYLAIMIDAADASRNTNAVYIDDISIAEPPSCLKPTDVTCSATTTTTATLAWTETGTATAWQICLDGDEANPIDAATNPFTLTGLTSATTYTVKVRANCGANGYSDWSSSTVNVTTKCEALTSLPWSENFESYASGNFTATCWTNEHISGDGTEIFKVYTSTNGSNSTHQLQLPDMSSGTQTKLVLPGMTLPSSNYKFSIDVYRNASGSSYTSEGVRVYASADGEIAGATELGFLYRNYTQTDGGVVTAETATGWYTYVFPIPFSGSCYIILRGESQWGSSTYMDNFKVLACTAPTGLAYSELKSDRVDLSWTSDADRWDVSTGDDDHPIVLTSSDVTIDGTTITYRLEGLDPEHAYTVKVRNNCSSDGISEWSSTVNFTTLADCGRPENVTVSNVGAHVADVAWTGNGEEFTVWYRTAAAVDGTVEEFATSGIPSGWENKSGLLSSVMSGTALSTSSGWSSNSYALGTYNVKANIYGTSCNKWLIAPATTLPASAALSFDVALTAYGSEGAAATTGTDDRFVVLISTDDMATWTILREWNNSGSTYVYNNIATAGENVYIDLSAYATQTVRIAFYGESTVSNADNDLHIDNVAIGTPVAAGTWEKVEITTAPAQTSLADLTAGTKYEVKVTPACDESAESDIASFTTLALPTFNVTANKWYALSSPMHNSGVNETVTGVANLTSGTYDFLRYDEPTSTWESQKSGAGHTGFNTLEPGRGYIYRRANDAVLEVDGEPNTGNVNVAITKDADGWNLIGNPFMVPIRFNSTYMVDASAALNTSGFYTLSTNGTWTAVSSYYFSSTDIAAGQAVLVKANTAGTLTLRKSASKSAASGEENGQGFVFSLSNDVYSDVAYAMFADGEGLPKISHLNPEAPMLSIDGYAIAMLEQGVERFPLSVSGQGKYTLALKENSADATYLHLIDRATGRDIDLLATPEYTFTANGQADRFEVRLMPGMDENGNVNFVYIDGTRLIVDGEGELQVFDVMGRQLGSAQVAGTATLDRSALGIVSAGVYVMRLGGNSQKIVVK